MGQVVSQHLLGVGLVGLEAELVDYLAEGVQHGPVVEVEHVPTHDGGLAAVVGEREQSQHGLGLHHDVVVQQQGVVAAVLHGLV